MMAYLHHIMFDPLSWWEQTKVSLVFLCIALPLMVVFGRGER